MVNRLQFTGRRTDDFENLRGGGELFQRFVALASEQRNLRLLVGSGGTATDHGLRRTAVRLRRFATLPFDRFAACFGAPFHRVPVS